MVHAMVGLWMVLYFRFATRHSVMQRIARCLGFLLMALAPTTFEVDTSYLAHAFGLGLGILCGIPASYLIPNDKEREVPQRLPDTERREGEESGSNSWLH
jgi:uncharacterized membrane protein YedE/YeeE